MEQANVQELVEEALENAIEALDLVATDKTLDRRLREVQDHCNRALVELRGYGHDVASEGWNVDRWE